MDPQLDAKVIERGKEFFKSISGEAPSIFNKGWWTGKVMDWSMQNEDFKVQLFRFVDVLPCLTTSESLIRHIEEYFAGEDQDIPAVLKWGAGKAGLGGKLAAKLMGGVIRSNIESMARQFIIGQTANEARESIAKLRKQGFGFTLDLLGEFTVSEAESEAYMQGYLDVLDALGRDQASWQPLGEDAQGGLDWGCAPRINVSVKPSALYSQAKPQAMEESVEAIKARMAQILRKVRKLSGFLCIDMESVKYKDMTFELYRRLRSDPEFRDWPHLGLAVQAYLKDTEKDVQDLLAWARSENLPIAIRLVKGAYWDYETVTAKQNGWPIPVHTHKAESDLAYERHARTILENSDICSLACASHNIRTISAIMETALALGVPKDRYEFQVLYGMAEPVRKGLLAVAGKVRLYCPFGELIPGMAYLVRRLLENTANESFLRQSFVEGAELERLLENPAKTLVREAQSAAPAPEQAKEGLDAFVNQPFLDLTVLEARMAFPKAIAEARAKAGRTYPLLIGGREVATDDLMDSMNPADPDEILGRVCQAGQAEIDQAIQAAGKAFESWRATPPRDRAGYLLKAAEIGRRRIFELSAWQVLEVGKQWDQAYHDVTEAIDFLEYYAREMIRLGEPRRMGRAPGEVNLQTYQPKGLAAVIAPWNFPLAISCGMSSAAIAAGNCVLYKPSGYSSLVGWGLAELFREAGLPDGVFNYVPGRSRVMGDYLVDHPAISLIAFTGSVEVGLRIMERAAKVHSGQFNCKKVVAEMGGKNAIIVDDDADLDEAVLQVLHSAFGFQGQKCSACSRVVVLDAVHDRFLERLTEAARSIKIGPAEDPSNVMGPVVDRSAQESILEYARIAEEEGRVVLKRDVPAKGFYVPLTIVAGVRPEHRIAQEEVFGPVLAVMRAKDFDQAIEWANSTRFALTGGIFSRSPRRLEEARQRFQVGNLYLNRGTTGAMVDRQPFGGFRMSGTGTKAGGPDYLLHFMDPRCVTENTMRRGFAPIDEDDDWIG